MTSSWSGYGNGNDISGDGVGLLLPLDAGEVGVLLRKAPSQYVPRVLGTASFITVCPNAKGKRQLANS